MRTSEVRARRGPGGQRGPAGRRGAVPTPPPGGGRLLVALPAWGDRCVDVLVRYTLPALLVALRQVTRPVVLLVWTDQSDRIWQVLHASEGEQPAVISAPPGPDYAFESMSNCHRQAMRAAAPGDRVLLLTADMVVSRELLASCERHVAAGKHLICCVAMRALEGAPPHAPSGRELLSWAWANRHPMTRECTWPEGRSADVWRIYFEGVGGVVARVFLPHPLVVVPPGRELHFSPTIDVNLTANFSRGVTHFITDPSEGAAIELSPPDKDFVMTTSMQERMAHGGFSSPPFTRQGNPRHRMFFEKRVVICGAGGDCGDLMAARRFLG